MVIVNGEYMIVVGVANDYIVIWMRRKMVDEQYGRESEVAEGGEWEVGDFG